MSTERAASMRNKNEDSMLAAIDDKMLADLFLPGIRAIVKAGGGAEAIMKKSEAMAALGIVGAAMNAEKEDVRLKAQIEILNRTQGKPVERRLNLYGDIADMTPEQIENDIINIVNRAGPTEINKLLTQGASSIQTKKAKPRKPVVVDLEPGDGSY